MKSIFKQWVTSAGMLLTTLLCSTGLFAQFPGFAISSYTTSTVDCELCIDITIDANGGTVASTVWDFMDGTTSTQEDPCHVFASEGAHFPHVTISGTVVVNGQTENVTSVLTVPVEFVLGCDVEADYRMCVIDCEVCFSNQSSGTGCDGDPVTLTYLWDFGDGNTSTDENPCHVFTNAGSQQVTLTATGNNGECSDEITQSVFIEEACQECACEAGAVLNSNRLNNCLRTFNASILSSGDCVASGNWSWNFGDGTTDTGGPNTAHTYSTAGTFTVTASITLTDPTNPNCNQILSVTTTVTVEDDFPCDGF